jgi:alcohol dehydrogenase (cytochrome c)
LQPPRQKAARHGTGAVLKRFLLTAAGLSAIGAALALGAAEAQGAGPFAGQSYEEAAARRGEAVYAAECSTCHGADLGGGPFGPNLKDAGFASHWRGRSASDLVSYVQARMPPGRPGSLDAQTYGDLAALVLEANGAAAGAPGAAAVPPPPTPQPVSSTVQPRTLQSPRDKVTLAVLDARKRKLDALTPVAETSLQRPPEGDWLMWRRTYDMQGFSPLKAISKANVGNLIPAWSWSLPESQNETTPLVHDGVIFVASGNAVQALDAASGDRLWQYLHPLPQVQNGGRNAHTKGMAILGDRLFAPTADGKLAALDIHTGALLWTATVAASAVTADGRTNNAAFTVAGAPLVARGKVMLGVSLGLQNTRGAYIVAFDAETGREAWRFNTIAQPGQPGGDSWNGAPPEERFGGGVWTAGSYDPARKLVFFGVGNTYDAGTLLLPRSREGQSKDALYTDATLALDPDTGKLVWFYQHMQRDVWDQDWAFEQTLATLPIGGQPHEVVVTGGKIAIFDVMDRATGRYLFSKDLGLQNLVAAVDPRTGIKTTDPAREPESGRPKLLCPSSSGARNWPATAFDPASRILYVPMIESCADYTWTARTPAEVARGGIDIQFQPRTRPDSDANLGRIEAVDLSTGKVVWSRRQRAPISSSVLATAGGLLFNGSIDRRFAAFDAATGKRLWETRLNAAPSSSPITYMAGGEQYVAVVAGAGGSFDGGGRILVPEIDHPNGGTTLVVFKLAPRAR